jgi:hypothetical protein
MKFDKNKDEEQNIDLLIKDIKKKKSPFSQILIDSLLTSHDSENFRISIKAKVSEFIEKQIAK